MLDAILAVLRYGLALVSSPNIIKLPAITNKNSFAGNPFLYHFQLKNLLKCRREDGKTIYDLHADTEKWNKLIDSTRKRNRGGRTAAGNVYECFRQNSDAVLALMNATPKSDVDLYKSHNWPLQRMDALLL